MKFKLKQEKLETLLEKLMVKDILPSSIISTKSDKLFSVQREEHARALRFLSVNKSYFEEFECEKEESIEIDVPTVLAVVKKVLPNTMLTIETKKNKLVISGENVNIKLTVRDPEGAVIKKFPFEVDNGVPLIGDDKIPLNVHFSLAISDFKDIADFGRSLKTEFYAFDLKKGKINVKVGDVLGVNDSITFTPPSRHVKSGEALSVIFAYAIQQIADTFQNDVEIKTATDSPGWFYEQTTDYTLGILVPPYTDEDE